jgi:hypothetical protein
MTTAPAQDRVVALFVDARGVHAQAIERLQHGDVRDAAEKAWCATKRATDALILALTGEEPETTALTTEGLLDLASEISDVETLVGRYFTRISYLHGSCFYNGMCGPHTERRIRETIDYISDAKHLATQ